MGRSGVGLPCQVLVDKHLVNSVDVGGCTAKCTGELIDQKRLQTRIDGPHTVIEPRLGIGVEHRVGFFHGTCTAFFHPRVQTIKPSQHAVPLGCC